jgi:succinate-acetate transporter protein
MTALDPTADGTNRSGAQVEEVVEEVTVAEAAATGPLAGDPAMLGLPSFVVGSVALGLALVGVTPAAAVGAPLAIILAATAAGLTIAAIWAAAIGASAVAGIFGIFAGFWLSYAVLVVGLLHNWFGIGLTAVVATQKLFLLTWLVIIVMLTLATLRLPLAFTAVFVLIDAALLMLFINTIQASTGLAKASGYVVLAFAALGVYLFFGSASVATGGKPLPLGKPVLRG